MKIRKLIKYITATILIVTMCVGIAIARPGGGHSSHHSRPGGGHSSYHSSGRGGGGGGIFYVLFSDNPLVLVIFVVGGIVVMALLNKKENDDDQPAEVRRYRSVSLHDDRINAKLKQNDPNFSLVIFKDFVSLLFLRFMDLRGKDNNFNEIRPFFTDETLTDEDTGDTARYTEVAINSITISDCATSNDGKSDIVRVKIQADYTRRKDGDATRQQSVLMWSLTRAIGATTVEPQDAERICCPCCGAPADITDAGTCAHCGQPIKLNHQTWTVTSARGTHKVLSYRDTMLSYSNTDDATMLATVTKSPSTDEILNMMAMKSGSLDGVTFANEFVANVAKPLIYNLYESWSGNALQNCRHLLSDRQYASMKIWTDYLSSRGVSNRLKNINVKSVRPIHASIDKFYDSITCEVTISCADYMENNNGKIVAGSTTPHPFKELFTFVRGTSVRSNSISMRTCPSCGAPADRMGESAICEYCGTKISTGKFSWVLSGIEQVC